MSVETLVITAAFLIVLLAGWALWYAFGNEGTVRKRRIVGALGCLAVCTILAGIFSAVYSVFLGSYEAAKNTSCVANMNQIGKAFMMYAGDNDERMPIDVWTEAIVGYVGERSTFTCPMLDGPFGYSLSNQVVGLDTRTVHTALTVAAFDGPGGRDHVGDASSLRFRHNGDYAVVGFLDGHTRRFLRGDVPSLAPQLTKVKE